MINLYPNPCYNKMYYKGTALYMVINKVVRLFTEISRDNMVHLEIILYILYVVNCFLNECTFIVYMFLVFCLHYIFGLSFHVMSCICLY